MTGYNWGEFIATCAFHPAHRLGNKSIIASQGRMLQFVGPRLSGLYTSGMLSIVGEREQTYLGSMHVHAQLLMLVSNTLYSVDMVSVSVYSYTHA